jgi:hypothetical protein
VTLTIGTLTHDKKWLLVGIFRFAMKRVLLEAIREETEKISFAFMGALTCPRPNVKVISLIPRWSAVLTKIWLVGNQHHIHDGSMV